MLFILAVDLYPMILVINLYFVLVSCVLICGVILYCVPVFCTCWVCHAWVMFGLFPTTIGMYMWYIWNTAQNRIVIWNGKDVDRARTLHLRGFEQLISSDTADQSSDWSVSIELCSNWLVNLLKEEFQLLWQTHRHTEDIVDCWAATFTVNKTDQSWGSCLVIIQHHSASFSIIQWKTDWWLTIDDWRLMTKDWHLTTDNWWLMTNC